jgi:hypothetical protein
MVSWIDASDRNRLAHVGRDGVWREVRLPGAPINRLGDVALKVLAVGERFRVYGTGTLTTGSTTTAGLFEYVEGSAEGSFSAASRLAVLPASAGSLEGQFIITHASSAASIGNLAFVMRRWARTTLDPMELAIVERQSSGAWRAWDMTTASQTARGVYGIGYYPSGVLWMVGGVDGPRASASQPHAIRLFRISSGAWTFLHQLFEQPAGSTYAIRDEARVVSSSAESSVANYRIFLSWSRGFRLVPSDLSSTRFVVEAYVFETGPSKCVA